MGCPHCAINANRDGFHCNDWVVIKTMEFNKRYGIDVVVVSGGEPTQHPNFFNLFKKIIKETKKVYLATNGTFLLNPALVTQLKFLLDDYNNFDIQITSIKGLYPRYEEIVPLYYKFIKDIDPNVIGRVYLVEQLFFLDENSGRAKNNDLTAFRTGNKRVAPECFNLYAAAVQLPTLESVFEALQRRNFSDCKMVVWPDGTIRPCALEDAPIVGNVYHNWDIVYRNLLAGRPCGVCGHKVPEKYARQLGWI